MLWLNLYISAAVGFDNDSGTVEVHKLYFVTHIDELLKKRGLLS